MAKDVTGTHLETIASNTIGVATQSGHLCTGVPPWCSCGASTGRLPRYGTAMGCSPFPPSGRIRTSTRCQLGISKYWKLASTELRADMLSVQLRNCVRGGLAHLRHGLRPGESVPDRRPCWGRPTLMSGGRIRGRVGRGRLGTRRLGLRCAGVGPRRRRSGRGHRQTTRWPDVLRRLRVRHGLGRGGRRAVQRWR